MSGGVTVLADSDFESNLIADILVKNEIYESIKSLLLKESLDTICSKLSLLTTEQNEGLSIKIVSFEIPILFACN